MKRRADDAGPDDFKGQCPECGLDVGECECPIPDEPPDITDPKLYLCAVCGKNAVNPFDGEDTCYECLPIFEE